MVMLAERLYDCDGVTLRGRACNRRASWHFETREGLCVKHYCTQHAHGGGPTRLLRPLAWEYDKVRRY
jgi:hypothetical protein